MLSKVFASPVAILLLCVKKIVKQYEHGSYILGPRFETRPGQLFFYTLSSLLFWLIDLLTSNNKCFCSYRYKRLVIGRVVFGAELDAIQKVDIV